MEHVQTLFGFLTALIILVAVHEFGHFYVARLCGVKVLRFCIGMGSPICSFTDKRGTEFALAPIPLGGYVKMLDEREMEVPASERHLTFNSKTVWQRVCILAAGPFANFALAFIAFWAAMMMKGSEGIAPVIGAVYEHSMAADAGLEVGQEIVAVDGVATTTRQAVLERMFRRLGETGSMELTLIHADSDIRYDVEIALDNWMSGAKDPNPAEGLGVDFYYPPVIFGAPMEHSAAAQAGIQAGDVIVAMDDQTSLGIREWIDYIQKHAERDIALTVERSGRPLQLHVVPVAKQLEDGTVVGQIGIPLTYVWPKNMVRVEHYGPLEALAQAGLLTAQKIQFLVVSMKKLVVGEISTKNLSGPIGIAMVAGDHARAGFVYFVEFLGFLSISLGVLNLLPIPILDGGHILYCLVEAVKGSPVSERLQMMGYSVGLMILAGVMVMALYNDILRF